MPTIHDRAMSRVLTAMSIGLLGAILLGAFNPAKAADKGAPAAPAAAVDEVRDPWRSCYVETGGSAAVNTETAGATRSMIVNAGVGCTYRALGTLGHGLVIGAFARGGADVKTWDRGGATLAFDVPATAGVRAGVLVSPSVLLYGMGGYTFAKSSGARYEGTMYGAGIEALVTGNVSVAIEYQSDALTNDTKRDSVMGLLRFRW